MHLGCASPRGRGIYQCFLQASQPAAWPSEDKSELAGLSLSPCSFPQASQTIAKVYLCKDNPELASSRRSLCLEVGRAQVKTEASKDDREVHETRQVGATFRSPHMFAISVRFMSRGKSTPRREAQAWPDAHHCAVPGRPSDRVAGVCAQPCQPQIGRQPCGRCQP